MAKLSLPIGIAIISISSLFISSNTFAHSEHDKSRFVAANGVDKERCDNVLRPCKTIAYAVSQAKKGDKVLVSSGTYSIESEDDLFYFKSGLVPIKGGYNRFDHFQNHSPQSNLVTLVGVPTNMREEIEKMGFHVAVDGKHSLESKKLKNKLASFNEMSISHAAEKCVNNFASSFECNNVDLLAHMPLNKFSSSPTDANDIWGHIDLNTGNEFAIIGLNNGVSVVNISDPNNPIEVGTILGSDSTWRDIKVYQYFDHLLNLWRAYAYATVDKSNQYVTVIDLNNLPNSITLAENNFSVANAHNVYISNVDHTLNIAQANVTPSLQLIGANKLGGAFHSYSLANPKTITLTSSNSAGDGYTHDGTSIVIKDDRKTTDCGQAEGNCTVFIDFQGRVNSFEKDVIKLWNISDANDAKLLSEVGYTDISQGDQYIHSGWATEDNKYFFAHDEFDEGNLGVNTTIRIFDIKDLNNPARAGTWTGKTKAIDHNGFVRGNRYYMSTYMDGLTILDITDPETPIDIGNFDTFTTSDRASYDGAWGVYPFLPSGNILISDISGGLFILKDNTLDSEQGNISFNKKDISTEPGTELKIDVFRNTPANNASSVSVSYELIPGSAIEQEDYTPITGSLTWTGSDNSKKTISIDIASKEGNLEFDESFFVRLFDPRNGATLTSPSYLTVMINGKSDRGTGSFEFTEKTIAENVDQYIVNVNRIGSTTGSIAFNYQVNSGQAIIGEDLVDASGQVSWAEGENDTKQIALNIIDDTKDEENESFTLKLSSVDNSRLGTNAEIIFTIADDDNNTSPTVTLSENFEINTNQTVNITAQAKDTENDSMTYQWEQTAGSTVELKNADALSVGFTAPSSAGSLTFKFTATDFRGASASQSITVTVVAPVVEPTPTKSSSGGGGSTFWLLFISIALLANRKTVAK